MKVEDDRREKEERSARVVFRFVRNGTIHAAKIVIFTYVHIF